MLTPEQHKQIEYNDRQVKNYSKIKYEEAKNDEFTQEKILRRRSKTLNRVKKMHENDSKMFLPTDYYWKGRKSLKIDLSKEEYYGNEAFRY